MEISVISDFWKFHSMLRFLELSQDAQICDVDREHILRSTFQREAQLKTKHKYLAFNTVIQLNIGMLSP